MLMSLPLAYSLLLVLKGHNVVSWWDVHGTSTLACLLLSLLLPSSIPCYDGSGLSVLPSMGHCFL